MIKAEELEKLELLIAKGERIFAAEQKARNDMKEFLQGDAKTRLQIQCSNFDDFKKEVHARIAVVYLSKDQ